MYSQYQQYQQNQGGSAVAQQPGVTWNGSAWVPTAPTVNQPLLNSSHSTYVATQQQQPQQYPQPQQNYQELVQTYTQYYHGWKAKETYEEQRAATLFGTTKQEAERQASWAKYYGEAASRAAHHYHNTPTAPYQHQLPPPPPPVPNSAPAPPSIPQPQQPQTNNNSPNGLKEYVHRCLSQCKQNDQTVAMQKQVEKMITQSIQDGTMHTRDWSVQPLLPLSGQAQAASNDGKYAPRSKDVGDSNYYGQGSTYSNQGDTSYEGVVNKYVRDKSRYYGSIDNYSENLPSNNRYYGNSKSFENDDFISVPSLSKKQQKKKQQKKSNKRKAPSKATSDSDFEESPETLAKRANRFGGAGGLLNAASAQQSSVTSEFAKYMGAGLIGGGSKKLDESDFEHMTVKGTCQTLEKEYLRLTAPPRAERVRPQNVLEKHLANLQEEWKRPKRREYPWFCSQLKAMRQDLTVQRVFNAFAVSVYETHARIALEGGDVNEYNQCQTQLKELYAGLQDDKEAVKNENEFIAYRLIYYVFLTGNQKYEGGSSDILKMMLSLTSAQRQDPSIAHALKVRVAVADFDYHAFFRLRNTAPKHGGYLMNRMLPNTRQWTLLRICKAYRPSVSVEFVLSELGFSSGQVEFGKEWLDSCGCVLSEDGETLLAKDSVVRESDLKENNSLI